MMIAGLLGALSVRRARLDGRALACVGLALTGFVSLSWFIKWQPGGPRFQLPLFLLMGVPCGIAAASSLSSRARWWLATALLVASLPWLLANESRRVISLPSQREQNIFLNSRANLYLAHRPVLDQSIAIGDGPSRRFALKASYSGAAEAIERSGCRDIGLIQAVDTLDYPLWALAWERGFEPGDPSGPSRQRDGGARERTARRSLCPGAGGIRAGPVRAEAGSPSADA